jgi:uncharacterized protein YwgA
MSKINKTGVIILTLQALEREGSWCGETHIQKALYLCQEVGRIPAQFKFILYKHGPYFFDLSEHIQQLIADELVNLLSRPPYGPSLEVSDAGKGIANSWAERDIYSERIAFISRKVGRKGVSELERLATAVFVDRKPGMNLSIEERAKSLSTIKPHIPLELAKAAFLEAETIEDEAKFAVN